MEIISQNSTAQNTYEVEFAFNGEEFDNAVNGVYLKRRKSISIPGFRKGKATRKLIEKQFGENCFYEEAVNAIYNDNIVDIVEKTGLKVVDIPNTEVVSIDKNDGVKFKITVTVKPEAQISDYKGLNVKKTVKTVTEVEVTEELTKLQNKQARIITVEGRAAEEGDTAVIDFEGFLDGVAFEGGKGEKYPLEIGSKTFIPGFEEQIVGKSIGDDFDVNVTFPEDYQAENLKGKEVVFKCKLHEIKGKELPELDDEFAKDSDFDTLEDLKADIVKKMKVANEERAKVELDNAIIDAINEKLTVDVPQVMYDRKVEELIQEWSQRNKVNTEDYLKYVGITMEQFKENFTEVARKQVNLRLALEKVAEIENIEVTDADIEKEYNEMALTYKMDVEKIKNAIPVASITEDLKIEKSLDFVRDNANIEEVQA